MLQEFPHGVRGQGLKLISDNGCQPSSRSFLKVTATLDIEQIFTSYNNPKGNAETERFMRTLKEELLWLEEFAGLDEAQDKLSVWIDFYNKRYLHSALGYKSPMEYEQLYQEEESGKSRLILHKNGLKNVSTLGEHYSLEPAPANWLRGGLLPLLSRGVAHAFPITPSALVAHQLAKNLSLLPRPQNYRGR